MEIEAIVLSACITIFSLGLLIVSLTSFRKYKNVKLLFVSLVFLIFLLKGILMSLSLFLEVTMLSDVLFGAYGGVFDVVILILLFIATLKR